MRFLSCCALAALCVASSSTVAEEPLDAAPVPAAIGVCPSPATVTWVGAVGGSFCSGIIYAVGTVGLVGKATDGTPPATGTALFYCNVALKTWEQVPIESTCLCPTC